jgi:hypothetical protein
MFHGHLDYSQKSSLFIRAPSHARQGARDHQALSLVEKVEPVQVRYFTLRLRDYVSECKMDVEVYMDFYMVSNGSCFMVTWTILRNHLYLLGPLHTRDWEPVTNTLQALSLMENAEPVQVHYFTLRLRDQRSM